MKYKGFLVFILVFAFHADMAFSAVLEGTEETPDYEILKEIILSEFQGQRPLEKGITVPGIKRKMNVDEKVIGIGLAGCAAKGKEFDQDLFQIFKKANLPVSIFADGGWLFENKLALSLATKEFSGLRIENHGLYCRSLSVTGEGEGTESLEEVFIEIEKNARHIERISGELPRFYRAGKSHYDDISVRIVQVLGYAVLEGSKKLNPSDISSDKAFGEFINGIEPGDIIFIPVNRPGKGIHTWIARMIQRLKAKGYKIVSPTDYPLL